MSDMSQLPKDHPGSARLRYVPFLGILVVALFGAYALKDYISFETLRENHEMLVAFRDSNIVLTAGVFVFFYAVIVAFSLPGATIATLTGGFLFGTAFGTAFNVFGATLGAVLLFVAARYGFGEILKSKLDAAQGMVGKIKAGIDENQWSMLFFIRLVPVVPFFLANLIPAFLGVSLFRFAVSTFFGIVPGAIVFTSVGAGLSDLFARGEAPDLGLIFEPYILLPLLGLCALSLLPVVLKAVTGKKDLMK